MVHSVVSFGGEREEWEQGERGSEEEEGEREREGGGQRERKQGRGVESGVRGEGRRERQDGGKEYLQLEFVVAFTSHRRLIGTRRCHADFVSY